MSCVTSAEVLEAAYIGSAGAVARFYASDCWPEAALLYGCLTHRPTLRGIVDFVTARFEDAADQSDEGLVKLPVLDVRRPDLFPAQKVVSRAVHRLAARDLLESTTDQRARSWLLSCSLPGSGHWLHALPTVHLFRVSSDIYRTMLCIRLDAPVPAAEHVKACECGMTGPSLQYGYHWYSQCHKVTYNTVRHNAACGCYRDMCKKAGFHVQEGETAHWVIGAPDLRPYDGIATHPQTGERLGFDLVVADPTRHGRLPTGSRYFKRGQAAALAVHRKKCAYGRLVRTYQLRHAVDYKPIGIEVTGGLGKKAAEFFNDIVKAAQQAKTATISPSEWSWSAQSFSSFWMMRISFTVAKITALAVHHGVRRALAAHAEL